MAFDPVVGVPTVIGASLGVVHYNLPPDFQHRVDQVGSRVFMGAALGCLLGMLIRVTLGPR